MASPKGNKNAVGHGRPPHEDWPEEQVIALGEELKQWMKKADEEKRIVWHLSEFYSEYKDIARSRWNKITERNCFRDYYEKALSWMGRRTMQNKELPTAYGSRFLGIYNKDVTAHEEALKDAEYERKKALLEFEAKMKSSTDANIDEAVKDNQLALIDLFQSLKSARKDAASSNNSDK